MEKLNKKIKFKKILLVFLLLIILALLIFVVTECLNKQKLKNNNDSNFGFVSEGNKCLFYYKYNYGLIKIEKNKEILLTEDQACSINYYENYLYYITPNSNGGIDLKKIDINGKNKSLLLTTSSNSTKMYLDNKYLYFTTSNPNTISKIDINGNNEQTLLKREVRDFKVLDNTIYFSDNFGFLYSIDCNGENYRALVEEPNFYKFQILDNYIYFLEDTRLMKINLSNLDEKVEVTDRLNSDVYNVTSNGIYYYDKDTKKICWVSLDNIKAKTITALNSNNTKINVIDAKLYYLDISESGQTVTKRIGLNNKKVEQIKY